MRFLCDDPVLQKRLQAGAAQALGAEPVCPSFESVKDLDLFEATAHEATRLKPIIPIIFLETLVDVVLGDVVIPAGTRVCPGRHLAGVELRLVLSMLARNFSVEHAGNPADVREVMAFTMMPSAMPVRLKSIRPS